MPEPAPTVPAWGGASSSAPADAPVVAAPSYAKPLPAGFDAAGFVRQAKLQFIRIQAAWDTADRQVLADVMTPEMLAEIARELEERGPQRATEVVTLTAEVLEVTTENDRHWASVHYTGMLREDGAELAKPFDEVWNLTKPVDGSSGWLLAGIQQLA
jgi:predicted lipid-binding transport protein (Tim44 family)